MARRRKASSTIWRKRVWSGSSTVSMLLASDRRVGGIHHRSPAGPPPFLRSVNVWLSFRTRPAISCVVVIQTLPMIGNLIWTTGPDARSARRAAAGSRRYSWLVKSTRSVMAAPHACRSQRHTALRQNGGSGAAVAHLLVVKTGFGGGACTASQQAFPIAPRLHDAHVLRV